MAKCMLGPPLFKIHPRLSPPFMRMGAGLDVFADFVRDKVIEISDLMNVCNKPSTCFEDETHFVDLYVQYLYLHRLSYLEFLLPRAARAISVSRNLAPTLFAIPTSQITAGVRGEVQDGDGRGRISV